MAASNRLVVPALSLAGLVGLWALVASVIASDVLPGPLAVWQSVLAQVSYGEYFLHLGMTLARVIAAFTLAMAIGSALGLALGGSRRADRWFGTWLIVLLNIPALVVIILCYVWFGLTEAAAVAAVAINKIPNVAATLREGARALSKDLAEMAFLYQLTWRQRLLHVTLPQLAPYFAVAARNGLALVWKIVLVVELLGRPDGIGFQLYTYFQLFDVATILAYALGFVVVVQVIEFGVFEPWERHANRWRR